MWGRSPYRKSLQKNGKSLSKWGGRSPYGGRYPKVGVAPLRVSLSCNQAVLLLSHATNPKGRRQGQSLQNYEIRFSFGKHVLEHISNKPKTWQHNAQSITTKKIINTPFRLPCWVWGQEIWYCSKGLRKNTGTQQAKHSIRKLASAWLFNNAAKQSCSSAMQPIQRVGGKGRASKFKLRNRIKFLKTCFGAHIKKKRDNTTYNRLQRKIKHQHTVEFGGRIYGIFPKTAEKIREVSRQSNQY